MNLGFFCEVFIFGVFGIIIASILRVFMKSTKFLAAWKHEHPNVIEKNNTYAEPLNLVGMILLLLFELVMIQIKVGFDFNGTYGDLPGIVLALIPACVIILFLGFNVVKKIRGDKIVSRFGLENENQDASLAHLIQTDKRRKLWHLISFIMIIVFELSFFYFVGRDIERTPNDREYLNFVRDFWGSSDGLYYIPITFIRHSLPLGQTLVIFLMYGMVVVLLTLESLRLSNYFHCLFHYKAQKQLKFKEIDTYAAYTHFAVGYLLASMILPPLLFIATLCLSTFADPAASIIGMKYGKRKYSWNNKSLEGTIAGAIAACISMLPLVGFVYSICGTVAFIIIDLITPKPIKISDNLMMPIVITIVFLILSLLSIPSTNIFGV